MVIFEDFPTGDESVVGSLKLRKPLLKDTESGENTTSAGSSIAITGSSMAPVSSGSPFISTDL